MNATYTAKGDNRTATSTSITVRKEPTEANTIPAFTNDTESRSVDENKANANVGRPITANDSDSGDSGKLTYTVSPDTNFSITDKGQLKTKGLLNFEEPPTLRPHGHRHRSIRWVRHGHRHRHHQRRERGADDYRGTHQGTASA